jgi:hypothetical protein
MSRIHLMTAAALLAAGAAAHAAPGQDVNLDGSAGPPGKTSLATDANRQLHPGQASSVKAEPANVKAQANADIAARNARTKGLRLQVQRQNLKGDAAARAIRQQTTPNTIDHDTAYGDKDHTEQVTNLKITLKK